MKYKTFILRLEDRSGHLLEVSKIISSHNANITRLSYNKVVDQHTVFIEVYADEKDIDDLSQELGERNYLLKDSSEEVDVLMTLQIIDIPGTVTNILQVFEKYDAVLTPVCSKSEYASYEIENAFGKVFEESVFTAAASLIGTPALVTGGVQLMGKAFSESTLLSLAGSVERAGE